MQNNAHATRSGQANKATIWFIVGFIVLVTVVVIVAGAYSSSTSSDTASSTFVSTTAPPITSADWTEGNPNAKVSLIEYGDFECPACGEYFPIVQQLVQNYSSTVLFVFRNFPLYTIHPFAGIGAQAAEAAGLEGGAAKYWAMHDLLYTDQNQWSTNTSLTPAQVVSQYFDGYVQSIGLDVNTFNNDMNATSVAEKIQTDVNGGTAAQIDHTPTFFVNLQQIPNPTSLAGFEATLNAAVASSTAQ
ncbi:MAG TPA: thioredoxin domain-containing protein [Candidatus Paceibacterota bacterium]|nr:thioredoxin domain-containing protein [Candidatus Paceibacterota bacterium]